MVPASIIIIKIQFPPVKLNIALQMRESSWIISHRTFYAIHRDTVIESPREKFRYSGRHTATKRNSPPPPTPRRGRTQWHPPLDVSHKRRKTVGHVTRVNTRVLLPRAGRDTGADSAPRVPLALLFLSLNYSFTRVAAGGCRDARKNEGVEKEKKREREKMPRRGTNGRRDECGKQRRVI